MIEKSSFKSGYYILQNEYGINNINENTVAALKNEKNLCRKKELYINLCEVLKRHEIKEILLMKEIMYSKINMFYDGVSFFYRSNTKKNITECYRNDFITPLISYINENKAGKKRCIECSNIVPKTRSMSFMIDSTDDVDKKKGTLLEYEA